MSVLSPRPDAPAVDDDVLLQRRDGRWIDRWEPEDPQFWDAVGARTAKRNLVFSILSEHVGFSVWVIWSVMVLFMPEPVWGFTVTDKFLLTTTPALLGSFVRLPYTFAIAKFGGRNWTVVSAALLLLPRCRCAPFPARTGKSRLRRRRVITSLRFLSRTRRWPRLTRT